MQINHIVYPTDFAPGAARTLAVALDLARRYSARLHILHVIYDIQKTAGWYVSQIDIQNLYDEMTTAALKEMDRLIKETLEGFNNYETAVVIGLPSEEIVDYAEQCGAGLIVTASHGRKGLDRLIFGSTSYKVVKQAHCPVLLVHEGLDKI